MARGEHIYVRCVVGCIPYQHHGIDMGDGTVVHLGPADGMRIAFRDASQRFSVRRDSLEDFCRGAQPIKVKHCGSIDGEQVAAAAESHLGKQGYHLLDGNCEHFARLCATGCSESHQIDMGHATVSAFASMTTKAWWSLASKVGSRLALRGAIKVHPAALLADGVEMAALAISCRGGVTALQARRIARVSGSIAALGIGAVVAGPAGAAACLAAHTSSTTLAEHFCASTRRVLAQNFRD